MSFGHPLNSHGYTLVEMLVALAVTSVVLAGTYSAYNLLSYQQSTILGMSYIERGVLRTLDLMESDIRVAGYREYQDTDPMLASQPIVITPTNPGGELRLVFDDFDNNGSVYRALIRYYLSAYTSNNGMTRNRLLRDWRKCDVPSVFCDMSNSTSMVNEGEPVLDWVTDFKVEGLNPKASGSFKNEYQTVKVKLDVTSARQIEGTNKTLSKSYTFLGMAKNVSLVP